MQNTLSETDLRNLLHYWRVSLADEGLAGKRKAGEFTTTFDRIFQGMIEADLVQALYRAWGESKKKEELTADEAYLKDSETSSLPVTILTKGVARKKEHGSLVGREGREPFFYTFFIPALLSSTGELSCDPETTPWIGREYLAPNEDYPGDMPIVGEIEAFDSWLDQHPALDGDVPWQAFMQWCDDLWGHVTQDRIPEGFVAFDKVYLELSDTVQNASRQLCQLYDVLIKEKTLPTLLRNLCQGQGQKNPVTDDVRRAQLAASRGTMNIRFGLAHSQSDALAAYATLPEGEILAVNGPPGTGKTTLLQSVIASEVVARAIEGKDPPVIVGASTNNQAVTNINKSLNEAFKENPAAGKYSWACRWIPDVETYGLYLVTSPLRAEKKENKPFKMTWKEGNGWGGFPNIEQDDVFLARAYQAWLQGYWDTYGEHAESIGQGIERVRDEIFEVMTEERRVQKEYEGYAEIKKWWQKTAGRHSPEEYIVKEKRAFDVIVNRAGTRVDSIEATLQALLQEEALLKARHAKDEDVAQAMAKRLTTIAKNISIAKSKIEAALRPCGFIERWALVLPFLKKILHLGQNRRLKDLADRSQSIQKVFEKELSEGKPSAWKARIKEVMEKADQNKADHDEKEKEHFLFRIRERKNVESRIDQAKRDKARAQADFVKAQKDMESRLAELNAKQEELIAKEQKMQACYAELVRLVAQDVISESDKHRLFKKGPEIEDLNWVLDVTLRHKAFQMAMRYWEGRWVLEVDSLQSDSDEERKKRLNSGEKSMKARFRRWCMLTPCLVSTLHSLPKYFRFKGPMNDEKGRPVFHSDHLLSFIDLLIIDEAGQVGPHIGAASFALARKAVVVGDIFQIEPIVKIPVGADRANSANNNLRFLWHKGHHASPLLVSETYDGPMGSLMRLAQNATYAASEGELAEPGIFLSEHRRCREQIISFCNKLVYKGRLLPMRKMEGRQPPLPPVAWAHLSGETKKAGGSPGNAKEAHAIAAWIEKNAEVWCAHYDKPLSEIVAVVTPFRHQADLIQSALRTTQLESNITVGTVHSLQGAERAIIIFSPVYNAAFAKGLFFDRKPNMLNVAVSRAKDSFVVIGDMRLFHAKGTAPSAVLGDLLFEEAETRELTDVLFNTVASHENYTQAERIDDLDRHRDVLCHALANATEGEKIVISSPWITLSAIEEDGLAELVSKAVKERGAQVQIIVDRDLSMRNRGHRGKEAIDLLRAAGAKVSPIQKMHNKTLIVGKSEIIEGSFNWLSAVRKAESQYKRYESSWRIIGTQAEESIQVAMEEFRRLGADC